MAKSLHQLENEFQDRILELTKDFEAYLGKVHPGHILDDLDDVAYWRIMARILDGLLRDAKADGKLREINGIHPYDEVIDDFETCFVIDNEDCV